MNQIVREARVSPLVFTFLTFIAIVAILYTHDVSWATSQRQSPRNLPTDHETTSSPERFDLTTVDLKHKNSEDTRETRLPFEIGRTPEDCDIFSGRWVRDNKSKPLYEESECPYLMPQVTCQEHGHPTKDYQHWRWHPYGCDLPTFNATLMLEALRGKRMLYVGDSLNRGQYVSMVCLLQNLVPESGKSMKSSYDSLTVFRLKDYNATIEFYWAPLLLESNGDGFGNNNVSERIIRKGSIDKHGKFWEGADIVVFNTYIWWMTRLKLKILKGSFTDEVQEFENLNTEEAYRMGMQSMLDWVQRNMDPKKTRVFFRGMSPSHTRSIHWGGDANGNCYNETTPIDDLEYNWASHSNENIMRIVDEEFRKTRVPISFLNITQLSTYRKDAHTQIYKKQWGPLTPEQLANPKSYADCVHWCLPGLQDTWNELLYAKLFYP